MLSSAILPLQLTENGVQALRMVRDVRYGECKPADSVAFHQFCNTLLIEDIAR